MSEDQKEAVKQPQQICSIRIAFPVESDEQAIAYKKKVGDIFADMPQVRIEFSLNTMPTRPTGTG